MSTAAVDDKSGNDIVLKDNEASDDNGEPDVEDSEGASLRRRSDEYHESDNTETLLANPQSEQPKGLSPERQLLLKKMTVVFIFAFAAGWADTVAVLHFSTFANMMTGNIIMLGVALASPSDQYRSIVGATQPFWYYFIILASSVFGAFAGTFIGFWSLRRQRDCESSEGDGQDRKGRQRTIHDFMAAIKGRFCYGTGYMTGTFSFIMMNVGLSILTTTQSRFSIVFFALSFAAQNVFTLTSKRIGIATVVMTSNTQKLGALMAVLMQNKADGGGSRNKGRGGTAGGNEIAEKAGSKTFNVLPYLLPVYAAVCTLLGAVVGGLLMRIPTSEPVGTVFVVAGFVIALLQLIAYILHDEIC